MAMTFDECVANVGSAVAYDGELGQFNAVIKSTHLFPKQFVKVTGDASDGNGVRDFKAQPAQLTLV